MSEETEFKVGLNQFDTVISVTDNSSYDMLVGMHFSHGFGYESMFSLVV